MDKLQKELSELWYKISVEKKSKKEHIKTLQSQIETMDAMMDELLAKYNGGKDYERYSVLCDICKELKEKEAADELSI